MAISSSCAKHVGTVFITGQYKEETLNQAGGKTMEKTILIKDILELKNNDRFIADFKNLIAMKKIKTYEVNVEDLK